MKQSSAQINKTNIAELILEAAVKRFSEYGYTKSTMAEIANDAGMSAANIYRYYKNKEEIAAACAKVNISKKAENLKSVVRNTNLNATQKLENYVFTLLKASQDVASENRKIDEICAEITNNRPDIIHKKINYDHALLMEILTYGNQTGEFKVDDTVETASAINAMLVVFDVPMFMQLFTKEEFEEKAKAVIKLIIAGLKGC